jgi:hypothetical protein
MENITNIKKEDFQKGFYIELECCFCAEKECIGASSQEELENELSEKGWLSMDSDKYQVIGHWCGCK